MRLFGLINICCLNPGVQTREEGAMVVTSNATISGSYFCLCYFNPDRKCIGYEEIMKESRSSHWIYDYFVLCEVYPWGGVGLCAVQRRPTDSSVSDVKQ